VLEREHNDLLARRSALEQKLAQANDALREALAARLPAMAADFVLRVRQLISELPLALDELVREVQNLATRTASGQEPLCRPTPPGTGATARAGDRSNAGVCPCSDSLA
jgi:hypothetical protein